MPGPSGARGVLKAYENRINRHDFDLLEGLIAPDAVFWFSDGSHRGLPAIRTAFEATWTALGNDRYWLEGVEWLAEGSTAAVCLYRFNWRGTADGRTISGHGRGTTAFAMVGGAWRIVHEHLSPEAG